MTLPNQPKPTICPICGKPTKGMPFHTCCRTQEPEPAPAPDGLKALRERVKELEELHNMQLAAIMTCKMQDTETSRKDRIDSTNPYWTVAYGDVCNAIDQKMALRDKLTTASEVIEKCEKGLRTCKVFHGSCEPREPALAAIKEWKARP